MKLIPLAILAVSLATTGSVAVRAEGNHAQAAADAAEAKPKPKKICKTDSRSTGTRISRPVCKTQEDWDAKEDGQEIGLRSKTSRGDMENVGGMNQP